MHPTYQHFDIFGDRPKNYQVTISTVENKISSPDSPTVDVVHSFDNKKVV